MLNKWEELNFLFFVYPCASWQSRTFTWFDSYTIDDSTKRKVQDAVVRGAFMKYASDIDKKKEFVWPAIEMDTDFKRIGICSFFAFKCEQLWTFGRYLRTLWGNCERCDFCKGCVHKYYFVLLDLHFFFIMFITSKQTSLNLIRPLLERRKNSEFT